MEVIARTGNAAQDSDTRTCPRCGARYEREAFFCPHDGARLRGGDARIGSVVAGDIVLTGVAGAGATGQVYRGWQRNVGRLVAVKMLRPELSAHRENVARFEREARIASWLRHPHVVDVYLAGALDDGTRYIVMEYLDGISLRDALDAAGGTFDVARAVDIVLQICEACAEAHAHGVIHRDLKPENVALVTRGGAEDWVKVLDFGIAKSLVGEGGCATAAGLVFGTARYVSPEGAAGGAVTPASDVYSIATVLYEMLVGRTPFDADHGLAVLVKQIHESPPDIRTQPRGEAVPDAIARVIMANLAKDPRHRARDARAFAEMLANAARTSSAEEVEAPRESGISLVATRPARTLRRVVGMLALVALVTGAAGEGAALAARGSADVTALSRAEHAIARAR